MSESAELAIRSATAADLPAVVAMLADDPLGASRESPTTSPRTSPPSSAWTKTRTSTWSSPCVRTASSAPFS